jgi:raffinose/stachyose/melibiose transport system permease protein
MRMKQFDKTEKINSLFAVLPALILFFAFTYYPLLLTLGYSFTDWDGFSKHYNLVGFSNFVNIFKEADILQSFWNTVYFAVISIVIGSILQLCLAIALFKKLRGRNLVRTLTYATCIISPVIVSLTWVNFFQYVGIINEGMKAIGLGAHIIDWLGDPKTVKNVLIFINTWQWTGYGMVIFLTGLTSVPVDIYESGMLDGATGFKEFIYLTLPMIMPSVTVNAFISITGALRIFDLPFVMTGGGPMNASKTISMTIYDNAFSNERFGFSSSIGLVFFFVIAIVTIMQLKFTRGLEVEH